MDKDDPITEAGIMNGGRIGEDRPMNRQKWLAEVFPEWGTHLNQQIENFRVEKGKVAMWWLGAAAWVLKTPAEAVFVIDNYSGSSCRTSYEFCGVCRTSGAKHLDVLRLNPHVIDPWAFKTLDVTFCTHHHGDHCDFYTIKATTQTTQCKFVGPRSAVELMKKWHTPKDRIIQVKPGDTLTFKDTKVRALFNYDYIASITGSHLSVSDKPMALEDIAVSYLFETPGGNILFLADTLYHNAYRAMGDKYKIDLITVNVGHNAPGVTDKLTPFDALRLGQALRTKVIIPDHYDNWSNSQLDISQFERVVKENDPSIKTVILQWGARFIYPGDQNIGRYKYPDLREAFRPQYSWEYGDIAKKI